MSWYNDCPLSRDEFLNILAYLLLIGQIQEELVPIINKEALDKLIDKLVSWLSNG
jgi:hypothetical protein